MPNLSREFPRELATKLEGKTGRGSGVTARQILDAPEGAIYVWCNHHLIYPRSLAQYLGREDLKIVPPSFVARERLYGLEKEIIIDHAVSWHRALSAEQWEVLRYYEQRLRVIKGASK